ncbi:MAG: endolytic transglycosylase MltG [Actinomycetota bacterium]
MPERAPGAAAPRRRRAGKIIAIVAIACVLVLAGLAVAGYSYFRWCQGASGPREGVPFEIPKGVSGAEVIASLNGEGVLRCNAVPRYIAQARSIGFQAGAYKLETNMTVDEALARLDEGPIVRTVSMTIPEGWRLTQTTAEAAKRLHLNEAELTRLAENGGFTVPPYLPAGKATTEGFLFPKTYEFPRDGLTEETVIERLLDQFDQEAGKLPWKNAKRLGVTAYEAVIVASLVEREAQVPSERARVAAVIYNRIARHEILGIDASNQYIDPNPDDGLTTSDLAIDSPYNLRLKENAGRLPPTPIASPGLASLRAALQPADTDEWLYVLCGSDGHHEFTASYAEFRRLKEQCL